MEPTRKPRHGTRRSPRPLASKPLCEHLEKEEVDVLPIVEDHVTEDEWAELAERGFAAMPKSRALVFLGHILEDADADERTRFLQRVPGPLRVLFKVRGHRVHARETAYLRSRGSLAT